MNKLLTIEQAAELMTTSVATIRRLIRSGDLHAANVGTGNRKRHWRIDPADIERYCAMQQPQPKAKVRREKLPVGYHEYV